MSTQSHSFDYYGKCAFGGLLSCGLTHTVIVPLDLIKCRLQVSSSSNSSIITGFKSILNTDGIKGLKLGWKPTFVGYSAQGICKFGLYEFFKDFYSSLIEDQASLKYQGFIWLGASATAEFFADIALCPMEMFKVKIQTSNDNFRHTEFFKGLKYMVSNRKNNFFPFGSLVPLWSRQIPYTMAKFYFFERIVQSFYSNIFTKPKESYSRKIQLGITFTSGYIAGIICAAVSQPADNVVSLMSKTENSGLTIKQIIKNVGWKKIFTKGLGARILMVGTLTGSQWWIYDTFKTIYGLGTSGGTSHAYLKNDS